MATLRSLAASTYQDYDIVVVDQGDDDATERIVRAFVAERPSQQVHYLRSTERGAARARNLALALAQGPLVALTDDDCAVDPHWLERIAAYFARYPRLGLICGQVHPAPHDKDRSFIPDYEFSRRRFVRSPWMKWREHGMSANMAFRLDALARIGVFDPLLGPGAPFRMGEDDDIAYRTLLGGYRVLLAPDVQVTHFGVRDVTDARALVRASGWGLGAAYMKHVRLGERSALLVLLLESVRTLSWKWLVGLQKHTGLGYVRSYVQGARQSFRYRIVPGQHVYAELDPAPEKALAPVIPVATATVRAIGETRPSSSASDPGDHSDQSMTG